MGVTDGDTITALDAAKTQHANEALDTEFWLHSVRDARPSSVLQCTKS